MKHKWTGLMVAGISILGLFAGCASTPAEEGAGQDALVVQVQSIENDVVTALKGTLEAGQMSEGFPAGGEGDWAPPEGFGGEDGDFPAGRGDAGMPDLPEGELPEGMPELPEGELPEGGLGGRGIFTPGEETITFTITEATEITLESMQGAQAATIEDITAGAILEVTVDKDGRATQVVIQQIFGGGTRGTSTRGLPENGADWGGFPQDGGEEKSLSAAGYAQSA